jgi:hypothetical protein
MSAIALTGFASAPLPTMFASFPPTPLDCANRRLAQTTRRHHRRPGSHGGLQPHPVPDAPGSPVDGRGHLPQVHQANPGAAQDRQTRLPVDSTPASPRLASSGLSAR